MEPFPHHYKVAAVADADSTVNLGSEGVASIPSAPPKEFGGSGEHWSPESLLVASVADCYIMTFKSLARASSLDWTAIHCDAEGTLDRVDRKTAFTEFDLAVELEIPAQASRSQAERLLQKAKEVCLITNSLNAECGLQATVSGGAA